MHTMLTRASGLSLEEGVALEAELDPNQEPFLRDHALNGIPLLPGVMGIEGLSTAAKHVATALASEKGSFEVARVEDVTFLAPFKFYRGQNRKATWKAVVLREGDGLSAKVSLESTLTRYGREPERMLHFTGKVVLLPVAEARVEHKSAPPYWNGSQMLGAEDIYKLYFHGPAFQVLEGVKKSGEVVLGKLRKNLPAITASQHGLTTAPILVELCLQTAGVWEIGTTGSLALPKSIGKLALYQVEVGDEPEVYAEVRPWIDPDGRPHFTARVVDGAGQVYLELDDYRTEPLPYTVEKTLLEPVQEWLKAQG